MKDSNQKTRSDNEAQEVEGENNVNQEDLQPVAAEQALPSSSEEKSNHHSPPPLLQCMKGIRNDFKARIPFYKSDFEKPRSILTVIDAIFFAFLVQLIPALIFAELMSMQTEGKLAVSETLVSTGLIGIIYALLSGQPLVLLGITGPVAMLLGTSYGLAATFDNSNYWSFFFWMCIWTAILHFVTATSGLINLVFRMTPFTSEIFEFFIAASFIYESIRDVVLPLQLLKTTSSEMETDDETAKRSVGYATLTLAIITFYICFTLHFAETWVYYNRSVRTFLTSYNMAIAVVVVTALSYLPGVDQEGGIPRVHVNTPWQPTEDRSWMIHPFHDIGPRGIFGALFPASMLYLLFYVDHNISSMLTQSSKFHLTKPPAYHWDFFVLGLTIIPCGMLGLPPGSGLIPQAPLHTRALSTRKIESIHGIQSEVVTHVEEQRWSALFQAGLMFLALTCSVVLSWIPQGALFGVFFYLGVTAMYGNEIWERIVLGAMQADQRPQIPVVKRVAWNTILFYTSTQVFFATIIFAVAQFTPIAYIFPALVMALVPLRMFLIPTIFTEHDLRYLDPVEKTEEEWHAERMAIHDALVSNTDAVDLFPGRSSFRAVDDEFTHGLEDKDENDDDDDDNEAALNNKEVSSQQKGTSSSNLSNSFNADSHRESVLRRRSTIS